MDDLLRVHVTEEDKQIVGEPDPCTLIYRRSGSSEESQRWFEYIHERFGPLVSPGGAAMYVDVSRAGIHKRLKMGKMTAFLFHTTHRETTFWGRNRTVKSQPFGYIPVIECKAWATEVALKKQAIEKLTVAEFEAFCDECDGEKRDLDSAFLIRDPKDKGKSDVRQGDELSLKETIELLAELWKAKPWRKDDLIDRPRLKKIIQETVSKKKTHE